VLAVKLPWSLRPPRCGHVSERETTCTLRPGHIRRDRTAHSDAEGRTYDDDGLIQDHWPVQHHPSVPVCDKCLGYGLLSSTDQRCTSVWGGQRCMFAAGHPHGHWSKEGGSSRSWTGGRVATS
jgi:hypothetical protein